MGLIAAALNAAGGTLASQWKEYFYVDALSDNVLATKAEKGQGPLRRQPPRG